MSPAPQHRLSLDVFPSFLPMVPSPAAQCEMNHDRPWKAMKGKLGSGVESAV